MEKSHRTITRLGYLNTINNNKISLLDTLYLYKYSMQILRGYDSRIGGIIFVHFENISSYFHVDSSSWFCERNEKNVGKKVTIIKQNALA